MRLTMMELADGVGDAPEQSGSERGSGPVGGGDVVDVRRYAADQAVDQIGDLVAVGPVGAEHGLLEAVVVVQVGLAIGG